MKNNLMSDIQKYYSDLLPSPDEEKLEQTIYQARRNIRRIDGIEDTTTFFAFFLSQLSFIRKRVWCIQFAILLFFSSMLIGKHDTASVLGIMSTIIPLIFLTWTRELSRAFVYETVEVELSTRFTLRQAVFSRIIIMGLFDLLTLTLLGFGTAHRFSLEMPHSFMFLFVPFLITAFGCLFILNHASGKHSEYGCAAWCGVVMAVSFYLATWEPEIYDASLIVGWYIAFAIASTLSMIELHLLLRRCTKDICLGQIA